MADRFEVKKVGERFRIVHKGSDTPVTAPDGSAADNGGTEQESGLSTRLEQVRGDAAYIMNAPLPADQVVERAKVNADAQKRLKEAVGMTQRERDAKAAKGESVAQVTSATIRTVEAAEKEGAARSRRTATRARQAAPAGRTGRGAAA